MKMKGVYITGWGFPETFRTFKELSVAKGNFDVAIVDPWVLNDDVSKIYENCCVKGIVESGIPLILNLIQTDLHAATKDFFTNYVDKCVCTISAASDSKFWPKDFSGRYNREPWLHRKYITENPNVVDGRFVLIPHCVSAEEFVSVKRNRPIDISVPGVGYYYRRVARELLGGEAEFRVSCGDPKYQKAVALFASKYGFYLGKTFGLTWLARSLFRRNLSRSKIVLTCSGTVNYPVRKFFEIPASGSILLGALFEPSEALGFRHQENCFDLKEADLCDLPETIRLLLGDSDQALRIAQSGQNMVAELHSVEARVKQLLELSKHVASGEFKSMHWEDGKPVFELKNAGK